MFEKVFITNLQTSLGYHLTQHFRNDHIDVEKHTLIIGTSSTDIQYKGVHASIDFQTDPDLACRSLMDCNVVIFDLRNSLNEAEILIKFLNYVGPQLTKTIKVIGISTIMAWGGLRCFQLQQEQEDKELLLNNIINEQERKPFIWNQSNYKRRIPNIFYQKVFQLENMLLNLNKHEKIKASVLATGMIYGKDSEDLKDQIVEALQGRSLSLFGKGNNNIALTSIQTLIESISLISRKSQGGYRIVCDKKQFSQLEIKQIIKKVTNNSVPYESKAELMINKKQANWSMNLHIESSPKFSNILEGSNFEYYSNKLLQNFYQYNQYEPKQILILSDHFSSKVLGQLKSIIKMTTITETQVQKVNQELIMEFSPPQIEVKKGNKLQQSQVNQQKINYYKEALKKILKERQLQSFMLVLPEKISDSLDKKSFFGDLITIVPSNLESQHKYTEKDNFCVIKYPSSEFNSYFPSQDAQTDEKHENIVRSEPCAQNSPYILQEPIRKQEEVLLLNQYLLDKVLAPIAQAKFNINSNKQEINLGNMIKQLKQIAVKNKVTTSSKCVGVISKKQI